MAINFKDAHQKLADALRIQHTFTALTFMNNQLPTNVSVELGEAATAGDVVRVVVKS